MTDTGGAQFASLVAAYVERRHGWEPVADAADVDVLRAEVLRQGRPGLVDVVARVGGHLVHVPFGLRVPGDPGVPRGDGEDPVLGVLHDDDGEAVVFDALRDGETTALLADAVAGRKADPSLVRPIRVDDTAVTMVIGDDVAFT
ncbi:MAG TPA: hypothetical protein VE991_01595, partial [Acidimicrobiales bacterium]|nr:hypothetical protein [Acidimicrobiales bacterium]